MALSLYKIWFPWPGALIQQSIIIPYEDDNTVIKYTGKTHIYCFAQLSVSYHTVEITDTNIPGSILKKIDEQ